MSRSGDPYDYDEPPRRHRSHHHHHHDDREPRYVETEETYVRGSAAPYAPDTTTYSRQTELVRRPERHDSDMSIEEVRREFPPPVAGVYASRSLRPDDRYGPSSVRSRSADRHSHRDDDHQSRTSSFYEDKKVETRRRSLSRNQKILAAVGGAALAVGGKELWDRKQASSHERPVSRNALSSAAIGAAGALAAFEGAEFVSKRRAKTEKVKTYTAHRDRNGEVTEHYTSEEEEKGEKEEKPKSRRKSIVEGALGLAGLGGAAAAMKGGGDKNKKDGDQKGEHKGAAKFQQAAKAALLAGATEAFRVRKEPGAWGGAKGKRILTAAIGAGGIDAAADRNPDVHSKRHILEAVVGGLAGNRLINGSRKDVETSDRRSRSRARSKSRARSQSRAGGEKDKAGLGGGAGLAALATAGLGALAGKKFLDDKREKSQERSRSRSRHHHKRSDSYDSRSPSPRNKRSRSKSVTDYARKGLAAFGIGEAGHEAGRHRDRDVEEEETTVRRRRRGSDDDRHRRRYDDDDYDDYDDRRSRRHGSSRDDVYDDPRYADSRRSVNSRGDEGRRDKDRRRGKDRGDETDSSLGSSSGDEKRAKKMKGKQLITMGLASVATIHAAHNVYQSMEKRDARHKAVRDGKMSAKEAQKLKRKAVLQDVASIGIAALGVKGAISEIKEANEMRRECREFREKKEQRHQKRLERLQQAGSRIGRARDAIEDRSPPRGRIDDRSQYSGDRYGRHSLMAAPVGYSDGR